MTRYLMKLLAIPALLAGVAQSINFTNNIPVNSFFEVGSEFVLTWSPETRTDTFRLELFSFSDTPILVSPSGGPLGSPIYDYQSRTILLDEAVKFTDGNYTWVVNTIEDRTGSSWYYGFGAYWDLGAASPRSFHLKAVS
ncbi:hypothetical protein GGR51DRAFT_19169 [Nemania sp. FL0031]|nr:hypothetical protein GGR51DRAFT_19169 [Nemania sp. FL0031]